MKRLQARMGEDGRTLLDLDTVRDVYIQGICGSAMAGVAGILKELGKDVRGCDRAFLSPMKEMLEALGIEGVEGYRPANLDRVPDLVVVGNVMSRAHPESIEVRRRNIPYVSFPELFEQTILDAKRPLVVAGTHGKTTTTALLAHVLDTLGESPGFLAGGIAKGFGSTARLGEGPWFVLEGDEYETAYFDKGPKFLHYRPHAAILTSVEYDHADIFRSFEDYARAFVGFSGLLNGGSPLVVCLEDVPPGILEGFRGRLRTYSCAEKADLRLEAVVEAGPEGTRFRAVGGGGTALEIKVPLWGRHNIKNTLAVFLLLKELGFDPAAVADGIASFSGVRRRSEVLFRSADLWVVDDFAHHPTAVKTTLEGLREHFKGFSILAIFEPRTNTSRTKVFQAAYADSFAAADSILILPPPAPKEGEEGFSPGELARTLLSQGQRAWPVQGQEDVLGRLPGLLRGRTLVVTLSNGSMDGLPHRISSGFGVQSSEKAAGSR
jgi:UDP-N-acetylmuramate: L-alanyl-gamma-D-glutamyl-meso-diaminopimelate ligase